MDRDGPEWKQSRLSRKTEGSVENQFWRAARAWLERGWKIFPLTWLTVANEIPWRSTIINGSQREETHRGGNEVNEVHDSEYRWSTVPWLGKQVGRAGVNNVKQPFLLSSPFSLGSCWSTPLVYTTPLHLLARNGTAYLGHTTHFTFNDVATERRTATKSVLLPTTPNNSLAPPILSRGTPMIAQGPSRLSKHTPSWR